MNLRHRRPAGAAIVLLAVLRDSLRLQTGAARLT
jgi:hypothetical protein